VGTLVLQPAASACNDLGVTVITLPAPPNGAPVEQCFSVAIRGGLQGTGVAGVYLQHVLSLATSQASSSPLVVGLPNVAATFQDRQILTAKSKLKLRGGTLESQEIILITPPGDVVEQALLLNGTGRYKGAYGSLAIVGNSIGEAAPYVGRICLP
jgi:hypothetical protein